MIVICMCKDTSNSNLQNLNLKISLHSSTMAASNAEGNVGVALGLVCGAGAATAIGASVVFFPRLVKLASRRVLAASLGLSAGVMTYVSFVEIFMKSVDEFALHLGVEEEGISDDEAEKRANMGYIYATLSFFGGVVIMLVSLEFGAC